MVNVRLTRPGPIPTPQSILPYRHALVVNEYEIVDVTPGTYAGAHDSDRPVGDPRRPRARRRRVRWQAQAFTLTVERYDAHPELEGERLISGSEASSLPLYLDVSPP